MGRVAGAGSQRKRPCSAVIFQTGSSPLWIILRQLPDGHRDYQARCSSTGESCLWNVACGYFVDKVRWRERRLKRASSLIQHWERRLEFCRLHVELRLRPGTETCAKWTAFLRKFEAKLSALRMRRDVLIGLEEAARLDTLPIDACRPDETINQMLLNASRLYSAESERWLTSASETNPS